jgi:hypothetical protein
MDHLPVAPPLPSIHIGAGAMPSIHVGVAEKVPLAHLWILHKSRIHFEMNAPKSSLTQSFADDSMPPSQSFGVKS